MASFSRSKGFVHDKNKENAAINIFSLLENTLLNKKSQYLTELRVRCIQRRNENWVKGFTIIRKFTQSLRYHFNQWKEGAQLRSVVKEMNDEGPIREQAFEERSTLINLTEFLHLEGYDDSEILAAL